MKPMPETTCAAIRVWSDTSLLPVPTIDT